MSHLPDRDGHKQGSEPLWAVDAPETTWEEPAAPPPQARAWFSAADRRHGLPTRIAGLIAVGALMTTGVAIAAFADDGTTTGDKPACSATVTTDCVKADGDAASTEDAKPADPPASTEDKPAKTEDTPAPSGSGDSGSKDGGSKDTGSNDSGSKDDGGAKGDTAPQDTGAAPAKDAPATTADDNGGSGAAGANDGTAPTDTSGGQGSGAGANDGSNSSPQGGSDNSATGDNGGATQGSGADDAPATPTVPVTNPLPPAPAATAPATTTPPATDDVSALAGLEVSADTTYFQLPNGAAHTTASGAGKGVAGGLADSGGANDIHAVGISALALLQLQRASSLAPPPAALPNIKELTPAQLTKLRQAARRTGVAWTVLAAVQRLGRHKGQSLTAAGRYLRAHGAGGGADSPFKAEKALAAYYGSKDAGERAAALAAYYWAVGGTGLTKGLADASNSLSDALLTSPDVKVYDGGRSDLQLHRIDPRVEMAVRYLQASFGSVSVSCLISGHSVFTSSGNVSAHIFGRAADIAAVGGTPIFGHQGPQTVTERAVRLLLMLPKDVAPRQIISLMDLDGATGNSGSFALPDHADHIHIGY